MVWRNFYKQFCGFFLFFSFSINCFVLADFMMHDRDRGRDRDRDCDYNRVCDRGCAKLGNSVCALSSLQISVTYWLANRQKEPASTKKTNR